MVVVSKGKGERRRRRRLTNQKEEQTLLTRVPQAVLHHTDRWHVPLKFGRQPHTVIEGLEGCHAQAGGGFDFIGEEGADDDDVFFLRWWWV